MPGFSPLGGKLSAYLSPDDLRVAESAYVFSERAHAGQTRASGKPFIVHPLAVADILADWRFDARTVAAALLHDVVEDTPATAEDIRREFGADVARIVDGVSKIDRLENIDRESREAENFRKLLLAAAEDWRVVFIKLADRLHNMRTLAALSGPERRRRVAAETLEIFAPIADRLGFPPFRLNFKTSPFAICIRIVIACFQRRWRIRWRAGATPPSAPGERCARRLSAEGSRRRLRRGARIFTASTAR